MNGRKTKTLLAVLLFLSLAANCFMGGILVSQDRTHRYFDQWKSARDSVRLPDIDQKVIDETMAEHKKQFKKLKEKIDDARKNVGDNIRSATPDSKALNAALEREIAAKREFILYAQKVRAETMDKLSEKGRELLEKAPRREFGPPPEVKKRNDDYPPFIWEEIDVGR